MTGQSLKVELGPRSYRIEIGSGTLGSLGEALGPLGFSSKIALISNPTVYKLYGKAVRGSLSAAGFDVVEVSVPDGEQYKSLTWTEFIWGELLKHRLDRASAVVALGGGVIGDMAGFAAATYMRGIRFVQVPTSLLAQVDSSVGGKTGINHELGKNLIGSFWQPSLVWVDVKTLKSLSRRQYVSGIAEVIKYGVIWDEEFFLYLKDNRDKVLELDDEALAHIISRSCAIKAEVVGRDERESGLRAVLNYGHTVAHAIEAVAGYGNLLHGEAVSIGMYLEALLSVQMGLITSDEAGCIRDLAELYGLPVKLPEGLITDDLLDAMALDKKALSGEIRFTLLDRIGKVRVNEPVERDMIRRVL